MASLNRETGLVEISRSDFSLWLLSQGDKEYKPGLSVAGGCFISAYLLHNNVDHSYMCGDDEVVYSLYKRYILPKWASEFAHICQAEVGNGPMKSSVASAILSRIP